MISTVKVEHTFKSCRGENNMKAETIVLNRERNVTLTCYLQEVEGEFGFHKRPAMIVLPGGGYKICSDREADPVALAYAKAGYQTFILRYTLKDFGPWPMPLDDYEEAFSLVCENAETWHVDTEKIAVVGFSAGGHLAACAATMAGHKPAAAILIYPATMREIVDLCQPGMPCPHEHVDGDTCPCFLAACRDDHSVDIRNTLTLELALAEKGIPFEAHIYSYGGHGFSTAESWVITSEVSGRVSKWVQDSIDWLAETMGRLTRKGFTEPDQNLCLNADHSPVLSIMCSLQHIRKQNDDVQVLLKPFYDDMALAAEKGGFPLEALYDAIGNSTVKELMETLCFSEQQMTEIDQSLHQIVNQPD